MLFELVQFRHLLVEPVFGSVNDYAEIAFFVEVFEKLFVSSFPAANDWRKDENFFAGFVENCLDDFCCRSFRYLAAAVVTVDLAGACEKKTHVVVNLGRSSHDRARACI